MLHFLEVEWVSSYKHSVPTIDPGTAPQVVRDWLKLVRPEIDQAIARYIDASQAEGDPGRLCEAMRYAALGPGKRLRPALSMAACVTVGGERSAALPVAAAIEMLHACTLVHDDLPAIDNDAIRRGQPTVHVEFGEAIAILVGDGLLTAAFGALSDLGPRAGDAVSVLARRAGAGELLTGQARDLATEQTSGAVPFAHLEQIHRDKTGSLFAASTEIGGIAGGASARQRELLSGFGMAIGVAFQHADDRDDGDFAEHRDAANARIKTLATEAENLATELGSDATILAEIARWYRRSGEEW